MSGRGIQKLPRIDLDYSRSRGGHGLPRSPIRHLTVDRRRKSPSVTSHDPVMAMVEAAAVSFLCLTPS